MAYQLLYLPGARQDLLALPLEVARRARKALERLAQEPRLGKPLRGELTPFWSYRVGDYRIVYEIRDMDLVVLVLLIAGAAEAAVTGPSASGSLPLASGHPATLSIPDHREVARGTLRALIRKASLTIEQFLAASV